MAARTTPRNRLPFRSQFHRDRGHRLAPRRDRRWVRHWLLLLLLPLASSGAPPEVQANRVIVYGGDENFPPYEFLDDRGEPAGLNIELMRAIAQDRGFEVQFRLMPWTEVRDALEHDEVQVTAMYRSAKRAAEVAFAIPHELIYHEMFIRKSSAALRTIDDLHGKAILVQDGTYSADVLAALGHADRLIREPSEPDALRALARGEGDVAVVTQTAGRPFQRQEFTALGITVTGAPILLSEYAFVTQKERVDLIELLNDGVVAVKRSGEHDRIYNHWVGPGREGSRWVVRILWGLSGVLVLVIAFIVWNQVLRRQVTRQTRALRREFEMREEAQLALAANELKLRQVQRMETVGRLAGGVAHDFNNVLTVILNYANFLRLDLAEAGQSTADIDEIIAAAERASRVTRQLLTFSRETPVEVVSLDLREVVREMANMIGRLVGEDIAVDLKLGPEPVVAEIDRTGIEQALLNLAANARDAMEYNGCLTIEVDGVALAADNTHQLPPGDYASIAVSDTGSGMSPETLARIAEPFFTTKEVGKGTGLGLASVYATLAKLSGKVAVTSELGRGSRFTLLLPRLSATTAPAVEVARPTTATLDGHHHSILLVEDDESLRRAAQIGLQRHHFRVIEARDGEHALELVDQGLSFSLLVTDVVMPRMNGPELATALRLRQPDLRVLYVSGYVRKESGLDLSPPGTGFLAKPYRADQLVEAVADLLTGRTDRGQAKPRVIP